MRPIKIKSQPNRPVRPKAAITIFLIIFFSPGICLAGYTNNILLTGYWPPTDGMLVQFSTDPTLNPDGWQGQNWENRGYDIYSYFPTFAGGTGSNPKGDGDFEVNYQDTSQDFWSITEQLHPAAILSYGNGAGPWEIEYRARNLASSGDPSWVTTWYSGSPNPSPPEEDMPAGYVRYSTLPLEDIADAIDQAGIGVNAWVDDYTSGYVGAFLCEYMAYHGMWYQSLHSSESDPYRNVAAGFTHVSSSVSLDEAILASEIALRVTIDYIHPILTPEPATIALMALGLVGLLKKRKA